VKRVASKCDEMMKGKNASHILVKRVATDGNYKRKKLACKCDEMMKGKNVSHSSSGFPFPFC